MTNKNTDNITTESDKIPSATPGDRRDPIELAGTPGRIAKFADAVTLIDSIITENAGRIGVGTAPSTARLTVLGVSPSDNGVAGRSPGGVGVAGQSTSNTGVSGTSDSGAGVHGVSTNNAGVHGVSTNSVGVFGSSTNSFGVQGVSPNNQTGVFGSSSNGRGVAGASNTGTGVFGSSNDSIGVHGTSAHNDAVVGESDSNNHAAVAGINQGRGFGVYGESKGGGFAGYFAGKVHVFGTLSKGGGGFTIDHPLDPTNKTLTHSFVESPDMMNIYNGNTITDAQGNATITLPAYFQALNSEFRYQLTVMEQFAQAIVSSPNYS